MPKAKRTKLVTIDEAVPCDKQHTKCCGDCPWARDSLKGWLGGESIENWLAEAHGEGQIPCHTLKGPQCAGAAIYRANVAKLCRDKANLKLPPDRDRVFATPTEFREHHERD